MSTQPRDRIELRPVSIEIQGCTYRGSYALVGETVTAFWGLKERSRTTRGAPAANIARRLLKDLVEPLADPRLH